MTKWRGIVTTDKKINEDKAVTIINRLGQKSIRLPRIDDKKRWAGYPGLAGTARKIALFIPNCHTYVEPFAGTAKVFQEVIKRGDVNIMQAVLNDKSEFVYNWLKREFWNEANCYVTNLPFQESMKKWNASSTVFLIDHPWYRSYYDQSFSCFNKNSVQEYDEAVLENCRKTRGKFIITTRKENKRMLNSGFRNVLVRSEYVLCGKYPEVLVTTNLELENDIY